MFHRTLLLAALALLSPSAGTATACEAGAVCTAGGGSYRYALPENWDGQSPLPVLIFYHGHRSSGAAMLRSRGLIGAFTGAGFTVVAPDGERRSETVLGWAARPGSGGRDNLAFSLAVLADLESHVPVDTGRIWAGGFSAGGSMAWMMACYEGARLQGAFSVAGALRRPVPAEGCPGGAVPFLQIHGYSDRQVPLEGRGIGSWHQGDVFESLSLIRGANGCESRPAAIETDGPFWCRDWTGCGSGKDVRMCLHPGGHGLPRGWTDEALRFVAGAGSAGQAR